MLADIKFLFFNMWRKLVLKLVELRGFGRFLSPTKTKIMQNAEIIKVSRKTSLMEISDNKKFKRTGPSITPREDIIVKIANLFCRSSFSLCRSERIDNETGTNVELETPIINPDRINMIKLSEKKYKALDIDEETKLINRTIWRFLSDSDPKGILKIIADIAPAEIIIPISAAEAKKGE